MTNTVNYFTDGGIYNLSAHDGGVYGYMCLDHQGNIVDEFVARSVPHIQLLECQAIYDCLLRIREIAVIGVEYIIHTDSAICYNLLNQIYKPLQFRDNVLMRQLLATLSLFDDMIQSGVNIRVVKVKAHCNNLQQFKNEMAQVIPGLTQEELEIAYCGNSYIDQKVNLIGGCKNLYSEVPYDNRIFVTKDGMFTSEEYTYYKH